MPYICSKCLLRVDAGLAKKDTFICPECSRILTRGDLIKVGKHFFARPRGEQLALMARKKRNRLKYLKRKQAQKDRRK